ncbi:MAG: penicillin-binding protein activator [Alphaproteobacteria bacterium]
MRRATSLRFRTVFLPLAATLMLAVVVGGCEHISLPFMSSQPSRTPPSPAVGKVEPQKPAVVPLSEVMAAPPEETPAVATSPDTNAAIAAGPARAALLLPLSGPSASIGEAMLNSAQMALFETADDTLVLQPYDTHGTPEGAAQAAATALEQGARIILGPVFSASVKAVAPKARAASVGVVSFSTDTTAAGEGVYLTGFLLRQQVQRVVQFARSRGLEKFAVLAPSTEYGRAVVTALRETVAAASGTVAHVEFYDPQAQEQTAPVRRLVARQPFDAVLLADKGARLKALASLLPYYDVDPQKVRLLGTQMWADTDFRGDQNLLGGWFATPSSPLQKPFADRYRALYGTAPPANSSLAYDAVALAANLARTPGGANFSREALTSEVGFSGIDGIFRLRPEGLAERGLAVMEVTADGPTEISPAPTTFEKPLY